jgi:hypothetical protein
LFLIFIQVKRMTKKYPLSPRSLCAFALLLLFLTGCNTSDPMIEDMEIAYKTIGETKGSTHEKRAEAVSRAVQKYFPPGMPEKDAFKLLGQLKEQGFDVGEYRHEGARNWPNGELKPYLDEATRRNLQRQIPKGVSRFSALKEYKTGFSAQTLLFTKHAAISFSVVDGSGVISESKGTISVSGI